MEHQRGPEQTSGGRPWCSEPLMACGAGARKATTASAPWTHQANGVIILTVNHESTNAV